MATTSTVTEPASAPASGDEALSSGSQSSGDSPAEEGSGGGGDGVAGQSPPSSTSSGSSLVHPAPVASPSGGPPHHRAVGGQDALRTVFVGGLPPWGDEGSIAWFFSALGPLSHVKLIRDPVTGLSKRYAFVTFLDPATAQGVKACQRLDFFGKLVDLGEPAAAAGGQPGGRPPGGGHRQHGGHRGTGLRAGAPAAASVPVSHRVFVGGLPRDATEAQLTQFFGRFGPVVEFRIIYDVVTGQSKGFGFASFVRKADADDMKARKTVVYANRPLNLGEARLSAANAHAGGGEDAGAPGPGGDGGRVGKGGRPRHVDATVAVA